MAISIRCACKGRFTANTHSWRKPSHTDMVWLCVWLFVFLFFVLFVVVGGGGGGGCLLSFDPDNGMLSYPRSLCQHADLLARSYYIYKIKAN